MNFYPLAVDRHSRLIELKFTLCIHPTFMSLSGLQSENTSLKVENVDLTGMF